MMWLNKNLSDICAFGTDGQAALIEIIQQQCPFATHIMFLIFAERMQNGRCVSSMYPQVLRPSTSLASSEVTKILHLWQG